MYRWTLNGAMIYGALILIHWLNTYLPLYDALLSIEPWQELVMHGGGGALFGAVLGCFAWEVTRGAEAGHNS
ncbi:MAG: hypothetical protein R2911_05005 [Caldilineaceae bacterium]